MILSAAGSGCFLFHKKSPQQEYTEALMHGNSMQASQLWLNMSPDDRMKFARGEGFNPDDSTKKDVQQMMMQHYGNQSGEGPSTAEQMEEQMPTPLGASLKDLPGASESSPPAN
jgi:redox-sensitive bicupin YhaK (pirin superfamily)